MSSDPPPTTNLCDMPLELVGLIAERIPDIESRCALGKCCRSYRVLMKNTKVVNDELTVTFGQRQRVCIQFDQETRSEVCYFDQDGKCCIQRSNTEKRWPVKVLEGNCLEVAVNDLMTILKNPKLIIKKLEFCSYSGLHSQHDPFPTLLFQKLSELNHKLYVEYGKIWCRDEDEVTQILPFFQPGTLKTLEIAIDNLEERPLSRFFNLEQWLQAEELCCNFVEPLSKLLHFKRVRLYDPFSHHLYLPGAELNDFIQVNGYLSINNVTLIYFILESQRARELPGSSCTGFDDGSQESKAHRQEVGYSSKNHMFMEILHQNLKELNHKIHVEECKFIDFEEGQMMKVLPFFKPGTLKTLKIMLKRDEEIRFNKIFESEQWKQVDNLISSAFEPLEEILHFKQVELTHHKTVKYPGPDWSRLKRFIEKIAAESDDSPLQLRIRGLGEPSDELIEYAKTLAEVKSAKPWEARLLLKDLKNGSQVVLLLDWGHIGIYKNVNGQPLPFLDDHCF